MNRTVMVAGRVSGARPSCCFGACGAEARRAACRAPAVQRATAATSTCRQRLHLKLFSCRSRRLAVTRCAGTRGARRAATGAAHAYLAARLLADNYTSRRCSQPARPHPLLCSWRHAGRGSCRACVAAAAAGCRLGGRRTQHAQQLSRQRVRRESGQPAVQLAISAVSGPPTLPRGEPLPRATRWWRFPRVVPQAALA